MAKDRRTPEEKKLWKKGEFTAKEAKNMGLTKESWLRLSDG